MTAGVGQFCVVLIRTVEALVVGLSADVQVCVVQTKDSLAGQF